MPDIQDPLDVIKGTSVFSLIDISSGYWQIQIAKKDRPKTVFIIIDGLFQFNVMPFGLCNAPSRFQHVMDQLLSGLK